MFEAQSKYRMGVLLWMSHPCWPSFVWQTYDYFFEPTSAYFACKKGSEPLHIQWNSLNETVEVVNYSAGRVPDLTAQVEVLNKNGQRLAHFAQQLESSEDSVVTAIHMKYPDGLDDLHFLRLTLSRHELPLSTNFYLRGQKQGDYRGLQSLPKARLQSRTKTERQAEHWLLTTEIQNISTHPALHVRAKAVRATTRDRILPAIYSDNYIALMPGERQIIRTELHHADTRSEEPAMEVEAFNADSIRS